MKKLLLLSPILYLFSFVPIMGQGNGNDQPMPENGVVSLPEIVKPSPTAYELGKFGEIPVGMFNGTASVSIPLYNYSTKNLSVPITLSYSNSGIRVDQISSWVGLGWNLNAGGVITRTVKDEPDPIGYERESYDEAMESPGFLENPNVLEYLYSIGGGGADSQHDMYNFNFFGYTGQFIMDGYGTPYLLTHNSPLRIEPYRENYKAAFKITTPDGVIFDFNSQEETRVKDPECDLVWGGDVGDPIPSNEVGPRHETSWYITSITHPMGDRIEFIYESNAYVYYPGISETYTRNQDVLNTEGACGSCPSDNANRCKSQTFIYGLKLKEIKSSNPINGSVVFNANLTHPSIAGYEMLQNITVLNNKGVAIDYFDLGYSFTNNDRVFLDKVTFKDPSQEYTMDYIQKESFPKRLTLGQDYWGYYNGQDNNQFLVPKINNEFWQNFGGNREPSSAHTKIGLLKRINYPTKGYNEFTYEPNDYFGTKRTYTKNTMVLSTTTEQVFNATENLQLGSDYHDTPAYSTMIRVVPNLEFGSGGFGSGTPIAQEAEIRIIDLQDNSEAYSFIASTSEPIHKRIRLQKNHDYRLEVQKFGTSNFVATLTYYTEQVTQENIVGAGMRIKKVNAIDPVRNESITKHYYYQDKMDNQRSSGSEGNKMDFVTESMIRLDCDPGDSSMGSCFAQDCFFFNLSSSSNGFPTDLRGNSIYYARVMVSLGGPNYELGAEEHEYILNRLSTTDMIYGTGQYLQIGLNNQDAANNGMEWRTAIYKQTGTNANGLILQYEKENTYLEDPNFHFEIPSYVAKKVYTHKCFVYNFPSGNQFHTCRAEDVINPDHPCYGLDVDETVDYWAPIWNLEILRKYDVSERYYLSETLEKSYDENGQNPKEVITEYYYDNPKHLQVTRTLTQDSKGDTLMTKVYYPDDVDDITALTSSEKSTIERLNHLNQHRVALPIQTESYQNGELLSRQLTTYSPWGVLGKIIVPGRQIAQKGPDGDLITQVSYSYYDDKGNPRSVYRPNGMQITYLWGYGQKYPVAKIENLAYPETVGVVDMDILNDPESDEQLSAELNKLRSQFPNAMVTTYTFDPGIGMTSMTDPRGQTTYYEYNEYNRLEKVRDNDRFLLQEYQYHYKNE